MMDRQVALIAKRVWYCSENDEAAFFEWLDKLPCVEKYGGELDVLGRVCKLVSQPEVLLVQGSL